MLLIEILPKIEESENVKQNVDIYNTELLRNLKKGNQTL